MGNVKQIARCVEAIAVLSAVGLVIPIIGLSRVLTSVDYMFRGAARLANDEESQLRDVTMALRTASLIYPGHVECLQRSLTVFILARRRGLDVKMRIGVQKAPFVSHAWIVHRECLFTEDEGLTKDLSVVWESL